MNTSYNYADFVGLNIDPESTQHHDPHPLPDEKLGTQKPVVKTDQLTRNQTKERLKQ